MFENPVVPIVLIAAAAIIALGGFVATVVHWSWIIAKPDEWLLRIRDGKLLRAGIGISIWRRPGDAVVRFTSAIQRVTFTAVTPSKEQVPFSIEGFALWTVRSDGDGPFAAFRSLGLANLAQRPPQLKSDQHLLTAPQYRAFQALLAAEVQQLVTTFPSTDLLGDRAALAEKLLARLTELALALGFRIEKVEISGVRPLDQSLAADLSAREERAIREEAERVRLESGERMKHASIESEARLAAEKQLRAHAQRVAEEESARALAESRRVREEADLAAALDRRR
ncbi:MAG: SPFH domain-containing protein, partial [Stellaceae bacterium]